MTSARISYGKLDVPVQRVGPDGLLAARVSMEVLGQRFLAAYTEGDNSEVVATDTMKNVILRRALEYDGVIVEALLDQLGHHFLETYPEMEGLALRAEDLGFEAVTEKLFRMVVGEHAVAELQLERGVDGAIHRRGARSGLEGFRLLKTTGSAFTKFARDGDTTLPERGDRPLFIHLDVHWRYLDPRDALGGDPSRYVAPAQARVRSAFALDPGVRLAFALGLVELARLGFRARTGRLGIGLHVGLVEVVLDVLLVLAGGGVAALALDAFLAGGQVGGAGALLLGVALALRLLLQDARHGLFVRIVRHRGSPCGRRSSLGTPLRRGCRWANAGRVVAGLR